MDFTCSPFVMLRGSSGFPFCLVRNLFQCLFTSLWIVLWWWLYAVASLTLCSFPRPTNTCPRTRTHTYMHTTSCLYCCSLMSLLSHSFIDKALFHSMVPLELPSCVYFLWQSTRLLLKSERSKKGEALPVTPV